MCRLFISRTLPIVFDLALAPRCAHPGPGEEELFLTTGDVDRQKGKAVYFLRANEAAPVTQAVEQEVAYGVVAPSAIETLQANMSELFLPLVTQTGSGWQRNLSEEASGEFFGSLSKFQATLDEAVNSLQGGFTLRKPEKMFDIENKAAAFNRAGSEAEVVLAFEAAVEDWCKGTERLLSESDANRHEGDEAGPETELEYWRTRMAKFNSITEQLKGRDCKARAPARPRRQRRRPRVARASPVPGPGPALSALPRDALAGLHRQVQATQDGQVRPARVSKVDVDQV